VSKDFGIGTWIGEELHDVSFNYRGYLNTLLHKSIGNEADLHSVIGEIRRVWKSVNRGAGSPQRLDGSFAWLRGHLRTLFTLGVT
jgi:hypothetical protein